MTQNSDFSIPTSAPENQTTTCSNCHSTMPADLRFCRNCGFRLADGSGGFTGRQVVSAENAAMAATPKKRRRLSGMSWIFVGLLVFFIGAAAITALVSPARQSSINISRAPVVKSYIGIDDLENTEQGVILNSVTVPGGPADSAGLLGGDIIMSVDGQRIEKDDQFEDIIEKTPIGKTVEIEYMRDGEKKKTKLTTISQDDHRRMAREFERRPEGRAHFGYEDGDAERVPVPGTKIYGVKLGTVLRSRPADIAGIKEGDIITEFDGVPIRTSEELLMRVRRALPYSTVKLVIMRGEAEPLEKLEIPVKMGKQ